MHECPHYERIPKCGRSVCMYLYAFGYANTSNVCIYVRMVVVVTIMMMMWYALVFRHSTKPNIILHSTALNMSISTSYFRQVVKSSYKRIHIHTHIHLYSGSLTRAHCAFALCAFASFLYECMCLLFGSAMPLSPPQLIPYSF